MAVSILMPQLGDEIDEALVDVWLKTVGDRIEKGEQVLTVTTPKVTMEIEAPASGTLSEILVPIDELAKVGSVLGSIEEA